MNVLGHHPKKSKQVSTFYAGAQNIHILTHSDLLRNRSRKPRLPPRLALRYARARCEHDSRYKHGQFINRARTKRGAADEGSLSCRGLSPLARKPGKTGFWAARLIFPLSEGVFNVFSVIFARSQVGR